MNRARDMPIAGIGLWRFSLAFYRRPGVAAALLALQDGAGLDVNMILFAVWLGLSGRGRIDSPALEAADRQVRVLRRDVIEPLRALRRRLTAAADADIRRLRDKIKEVELDAEKAAQDRLARHAGAAMAAGGRECLADAAANLACCLGPEAGHGSEAATILNEIERFAEQAFTSSRPVRPSG
ncbi:MAG: TIGR02444 family protein [Stellaceae bacterium]